MYVVKNCCCLLNFTIYKGDVKNGIIARPYAMKTFNQYPLRILNANY